MYIVKRLEQCFEQALFKCLNDNNTDHIANYGLVQFVVNNDA